MIILINSGSLRNGALGRHQDFCVPAFPRNFSPPNGPLWSLDGVGKRNCIFTFIKSLGQVTGFDRSYSAESNLPVAGHPVFDLMNAPGSLDAPTSDGSWTFHDDPSASGAPLMCLLTLRFSPLACTGTAQGSVRSGVCEFSPYGRC